MRRASLLFLSRIAPGYVRQLKNMRTGNRQSVLSMQTIPLVLNGQDNKTLDYNPEKVIASQPAFNNMLVSIEKAIANSNFCSYVEYCLNENFRKRTFQFGNFKVVIARKSTMFQVPRIMTFQITFITISFNYNM